MLKQKFKSFVNLFCTFYYSKIIDIINSTFVFIITIYYITWKTCEYIKYVCIANTIKSLQNSSQIIFKPLYYFEHLQQQKSSHSNLSWEFLSYPLLLLLSLLLLLCSMKKKLYKAQNQTRKGHFCCRKKRYFCMNSFMSSFVVF